MPPALADDFATFLAARDRVMLLAGAAGTRASRGPKRGLAFVTESELYAGIVRAHGARGAPSARNVDAMVRDLSEVRIGDPVVHEQHGIGRYLGLLTLDLGEGPNEFLQLVYANDAKLYVPVSNLHLISRYSGASPEAAPLHELGSGQWEKAKSKAAQQVHDTAAELLNLYAQRAARTGHAFELQAARLRGLRRRLRLRGDARPGGGDRGGDRRPDVGQADGPPGVRRRRLRQDRGRAARRVRRAGRRQAGRGARADHAARRAALPDLLRPLRRLAGAASRSSRAFARRRRPRPRSKGSPKARIDIVIGTHKLLQADVKFKNLGLVIIDEEHRFGVRQKERLKRLRAEVDVLTLTATPIPRTLAMSLEGMRDFSVIATAPQRRLAIKTFVAALFARHRARGRAARTEARRPDLLPAQRGRHDRARAPSALAKLLPEARIAVAHGQMRERELEQVMRDFYQQRFNLLLCSTIIETGIDVPTANTIIIDRADRFGLAQLHQLRGRVGRSHHQAYAYLLTPPEDALSAQAKKRLEAIQMMEDLGSGFFLAMHDLEIRGAGEVLGESQSGEMQEVGFQLYTDMLRAAVTALQGRARAGPHRAARRHHRDQPARAGAAAGALLQRRARAPRALQAPRQRGDDRRARRMQEELVDRFGPPPEPAQALLASHRLRARWPSRSA